ncbi:MAG: transposase, partial [Anaeroplasmataceae bacterium]|nr:transposase [Anaeroplasmataceae bacterium]
MDYESIKRLGLDHYNIDLEKSYEIFDSIQNNHIIYLYLLKDENIFCPNCGSLHCMIRGSKKCKIKYASSIEDNITIVLTRRQYTCTDCNHTFKQSNPIMREGKTISIQKDFCILESLRDKNKTYSSVAKEYDVSVTYVQNLFDKKVSLKRLSLPTVLCIDEVYARRLTKHKYCCVLYAPQWKKIVDILPSRHKLNLIDYFARIPISEKDKVKYISMDLWDSYREMAHLCFPKAKVCADSFHIIKHLLERFRKIRIDVMKRFEHLKHEDHNFY